MSLSDQQPILYGGVVTHLRYLECLEESRKFSGELCVHENKLKKLLEAHLTCHHLFEAFLEFTKPIPFSCESSLTPYIP